MLGERALMPGLGGPWTKMESPSVAHGQDLVLLLGRGLATLSPSFTCGSYCGGCSFQHPLYHPRVVRPG